MRREQRVGEPGREGTGDQVQDWEEGGRRPGHTGSIIDMPGTASPSRGRAAAAATERECRSEVGICTWPPGVTLRTSDFCQGLSQHVARDRPARCEGVTGLWGRAGRACFTFSLPVLAPFLLSAWLSLLSLPLGPGVRCWGWQGAAEPGLCVRTSPHVLAKESRVGRNRADAGGSGCCKAGDSWSGSSKSLWAHCNLLRLRASANR